MYVLINLNNNVRGSKKFSLMSTPVTNNVTDDLCAVLESFIFKQKFENDEV